MLTDDAEEPRRMNSTFIARLTRALLTVALIAICTAPPAAAHTKLTTTSPGDGSMSARPVSAVILTFSLPVTPVGDAVEIHGPEGAVAAAVVRAQDGTSVTAKPAAPLTGGHYTVSWTVAAQDGHTIDGNFEFTVEGRTDRVSEKPTKEPAQDPEQEQDNSPSPHAGHDMSSMEPDHEPPPIIDASGRFGSAVMMWGWLVAAGGLAFAGLVLRGRDGNDETAVLRTVRWSGALVLVGTALRVAAQSATLTHGDLVAAASPDAIGDALAGAAGWVAGLQAVGAITVLAGTGRTIRGSAAALAGVVVAGAGFVLDGHSNMMEPRWLVLTADIIHLAAAATWVGGLVALTVVLHRHLQDDRRADTVLVAARFSVVAAASLAAVAVAGIALALTILERPDQLWTTDWGLALLGKTAVVVAVGLIGAYNHFHTIPHLTSTASRRHGRSSPGPLRRSAAPEIALMIAVVLLTGWLVGASTNA